MMSAPQHASTSTVDINNDDLSEQSDDIHINWKERCILLEASLQKFKQQASNIRQLLSERVRTYRVL